MRAASVVACPFVLTRSVPTVATAVVPAGAIQDYNSYQSAINSVVLASAEKAAASNGTTVKSAAPKAVSVELAAWV